MINKNAVQNEHSRLEALRLEGPQWVDQARKALGGWRPGENYLVTVMALSLREAYEAGLRGEEYPPIPKPTRRVRAAKAEEAEPEPEAPTNRVRRRRGAP